MTGLKSCSPVYIFAAFMQVKKLITVSLILVIVLQLLPVKQAVKYFLFDNIMVEEMIVLNKKVTENFRLLVEDHNIYDHDFSFNHYVFVSSKLSYHFAELLPANHSADIHTPPPNIYSFKVIYKSRCLLVTL